MTSRGNGEPSGKNPSPAPIRKITGFAETLRREFRECIKRLTEHAPGLQRKARRRRTDETGKAFRPTAAQLFNRVTRSIFHAAHFTWREPDAIDPANLYTIHAQNAYQGSQPQNNDAVVHQNLFPHL